MIGSKSMSDIRCSRLAHDVHHPVECTGILHRHEAVAFEHEFGHAHQHGEEIMKQRRRIGAEKLAPHSDGRTEAEWGADVELRRHDVDDAALFDLYRITGIAEG